MINNLTTVRAANALEYISYMMEDLVEELQELDSDLEMMNNGLENLNVSLKEINERIPNAKK